MTYHKRRRPKTGNMRLGGSHQEWAIGANIRGARGLLREAARAAEPDKIVLAIGLAMKNLRMADAKIGML